ncbi:hypothetical protein [Pseudomonas oryzihabitans]|uniref:hypothetical protein n=1 Tax=Pseudomonas oryzihabitans TaxID=47885 RepID=UPI0028598DB7|nr:hypothetical protein [Pseudomonas psychrotolerans]MDR6679858.1 hypothetical protein [Pseudomonas psychrotolerans]
MKNFLAVMFVGGLLGASLSAKADEIYRGVMDIDGKGLPVAANNASTVRHTPVILTLAEHPKLGELGGKIRFAEPWACGFSLVYAGRQYALEGVGAGKCVSLTQGYLTGERAENDEMKISIYGQNGKPVTTLDLKKDSSK